MNAYEKAKSLGLDTAIVPDSDPPRGYTDTEIIAVLQALPLHHKNAYITGGPSDTESVNLLHLLTARYRVMGMGAAQQWVGPLIDEEGTSPTVAAIMSMLRPMLQVNDTLVYCADSEDAANMLNALTAIVAGLTEKHDQVKAEITLLTGGRIGDDYATVTPEQFAGMRIAALKQVALDLVQNTAAEAAREECRKADSTPESIVAAAVAVLGGA